MVQRFFVYGAVASLLVLSIFDGSTTGEQRRFLSATEGETQPHARSLVATGPVTLNFDDLVGIDYLPKDYYNASYGLVITAASTNNLGYTPNGSARIFDTANPSAADLDLGSPNENCPTSPGPGVGDDGVPSNCLPQGNALIIQEQDEVDPNDYSGGGSITFSFDVAVRFTCFAVMDQEAGFTIDITRSDGSVTPYSYQGLGDNSVQKVNLNETAVKEVTVNFPGEGAIPELCFELPSGTEGIMEDPLILGLDGSIFRFDGHSGLWYSTASAASFQWNMRFQQFEDCPADSDDFSTGMGLTLLDKESGEVKHQILVNVVNPENVNTGCGNNFTSLEDDYDCLGAGSLELVIDGRKTTQSLDLELEDGISVLAYNIIPECSRRWFDFDLTPPEDVKLPSHMNISTVHDEEQRGRRFLESNKLQDAGIFYSLEHFRSDMLDPRNCEAWLEERKKNNDILDQPGTWSTVEIQTPTISFLVEYKQEWERCNAHHLDLWITDISLEALEEEWEGIIGETKHGVEIQVDDKEKQEVDREEALKYSADEDYEVHSPYTLECNACISRD